MSSRGARAIFNDLQEVEFETSEDIVVVSTFQNMGLRKDLLRGVNALGKEKYSMYTQLKRLLSKFNNLVTTNFKWGDI